MPREDSSKKLVATYVLRTLLEPWRAELLDHPEYRLAMAIALEELAAELRQEASEPSEGE